MTIQGATALATGANRGLGRHLARQLRDRGANVCAGARNPGSVEILADEVSTSVRARLAGGVAALYPAFA